MTIYKEIEAVRQQLVKEFGSDVVMKGSSFSDWVVYVLTPLSKAGGSASNPYFRAHMVTAAAMTILAIEAVDRRLKEHD